ncbi:GlnS Glutamyl- and glutaminyl-tRNA synthetases [Oxalobacteraceae bacterium]|jgi:glutamyl-Q tRNA(Asp) synthetase
MYIGRFAPSPTGPLHAGSLVAALASYLDARSNRGHWLIRIEDIDEARTVAGAAEHIIQTLAALGMRSDGEILWQSTRQERYNAAFNQLGNAVYACACSRREIADSRVSMASDGAAIYPGTCRHGLAPGRVPRAWRVRVPDANDSQTLIQFHDRWQGLIEENLAAHVGDFVLKRADGFWAYQLAVVVDDAEQGVTDIVRGADLLESTTRQIYLQRLLGFSTPRYLHVPAVVNDRGEKLSKQTGAQPIDTSKPINALMEAASHLGLMLSRTPSSVDEFWTMAILEWEQRFVRI